MIYADIVGALVWYFSLSLALSLSLSLSDFCENVNRPRPGEAKKNVKTRLSAHPFTSRLDSPRVIRYYFGIKLLQVSGDCGESLGVRKRSGAEIRGLLVTDARPRIHRELVGDRKSNQDRGREEGSVRAWLLFAPGTEVWWGILH